MNDYKKELEDILKENSVKYPYCSCKDIGIDSWDMFTGKRDWFYYCKKCDTTFVIE